MRLDRCQVAKVPEAAPSGDDINRPAVIAEVRAVFEAYERALVDNDVTALNAFFWDHADTVRYGIHDHARGAPAIRAWRGQARPVDPRRILQHTVISSFGDHYASVSTEFLTPDSARIGRQTQTWVRLPGGWKIVAAHVSEVETEGLARF
jgi:hypothetical protein